MEWTKEQQCAIDTKGCSLLVAAAAGAGKTAVLVERIIKKLMDDKNPIDIDRLLVLTFTNAAASEMRDRIGEAISKELESNPKDTRLQMQHALLGSASINTIHAFCLDVIRSNFHCIDLDPAFRIADGTECVLLKKEVLEEMFDEKYEKNNEDFLNLVECYGSDRSDTGLQDMVLRLYEFSGSMPYPKEWLKDTVLMFNVNDDFDFGKSKWASVLLEDLKIELCGLYNSMNSALQMIEGLSDFEGYLCHIKNEMDGIKQLMDCCSFEWDEAASRFQAFEFKSLPRCKKGADEKTKEEVSKIRDRVKKRIMSIRDGVLSWDSKKVAAQLKSLYPSMAALASLAAEFGDRYQKKKKDRGVIDFNDIEHYAIEILAEKREDGVYPTPAAERYREKFEEVLVDEYQDINMVQELILSMVSRKDTDTPNLFMVGDIKQSIYRFRHAKPELFLEKYQKFGHIGKERRILLYKNFRSRHQVLDAANYIFKSIMSKNIGELEYDDDEKLNPGANYPDLKSGEGMFGGPVEVHIIESSAEEIDNTEDEDIENRDDLAEAQEDLTGIQLEARMVANRINSLVHEQKFMVAYEDKNETDKSKRVKYRPAEYRDIVVLMRSVSGIAPIFVEEFSKLSVPVYFDGGNGYFDVAEIKAMVSLLEIIDNPMQDIPLLAVLRSPIGGFTPKELIDIRLCDKNKTYFEALKAKSCEEGELSEKARGFLQKLSIWRKKSRTMAISDFIWYLYDDTGYFAYAGAMPGGVQRQANLRILFERARQYEETSFKGLFNFVNFINKLKTNSGDMGEAKSLGENENVVRIMSIHKSKGLEFPVVFVSGLGKRFNLMDLKSKVLFHHTLGFGPDYIDTDKRFYYTTIVKQALKKMMKLETYSEEMRILYVAMTRAKEKLILTGTAGKLDSAFSRWKEGVNLLENKVPEYQILQGTNFLDWICPSLLKHCSLREFREAAGAQVSPSAMVDDASEWEISILRRENISKQDINKVNDAAAGSDSMERSKYYDEVIRRLNYKYPYEKSSMIHAKLTVTELKKMMGTSLDEENTGYIFKSEIKRKPAFLEGKMKLSAAEAGTAMHLVMQHVPLDKIVTVSSIKELLDYLTLEEFLTKDQKSYVDAKRIVGFYESSLGQRLLKSKCVKRELPFYMEIDGSEVYSDLNDEIYKNEKVILQGVIDCFFEEDDGLVLIDYKTDYVPDNNTDIIKERYKVQMDYYSKALERLTGKRVKEKYIYLFYNGEIVEF